MRHGWTVSTRLICVVLALGAINRLARSGEPLDDRLGIRLAPIVLLSRADVQADLKLSPVQISESRREAEVLYYKALGLRGKTEPGDLAARRAIDEEQNLWLKAHLAEPQLNRLDQIDLQWQGAAAMLSRPFVAEYLNLTPDQRDNLARCVKEGAERRARAAWTYADHVLLTRKAISILSEKQQSLWIHVLGPPCQFSIGSRPPATPGQTAAAGSLGQPQFGR
jgi:hypothetical protein